MEDTMSGQVLSMKSTTSGRRMMRALKRRRRSREGMTLVEIMIVVIIMALIATAVGVAVLPQLQRARVTQSRSDALEVRSAVLLYMGQEAGADCPTMDELVQAGVLDHSRRTNDAWDNPFIVECEGEDIAVISNGPDGQSGTEDDIRP
jgi:general secretion pathway protein G